MTKSILATIFLICFAVTLIAQTKKYDSLDVIIQGSLSIYRSVNNFHYIEKGDSLVLLPPTTKKMVVRNGERKMLTSYPFRGVLNYYLQSCKKIGPAIANLRLNDDDLIKVMQKYFACTDEKPTQVESATERFAFRMGINAGVQITPLKVESIPYDPKSNNKAIFGLSYEFLSLKQLIAFSGQFNFTQYEYTDQEDDFVEESTSFKQIQGKLGLKKYFGDQLKPFIKTGVVFNYNYENEQTPLDFYNWQKFSVNFEIGAGVEKALNEKFTASLELTQGFFNSAINHDAFELVPRPLTIQLILLYRIK